MSELPLRECDECHELFEPQQESQRFCSKRHRQRWHAREARKRQRGEDRAAEYAAEEGNLDEVIRQQQERDEEQQRRQELRQATAAESRLRRYLAVLEGSLKAYKPTPLVRPTNRRRGMPTHEWIFCTSDWHTGQKTTMAETGGVYEQDIATTRAQVAKLWKALAETHAIESQSRNIEKLHILSIGDLIDGDDMRPSQHRQVEDIMTVQTVQAFDLAAWLIRQALTIFPEVEVDLVGGNHDRTTRAKGNAGLGELSYMDTMSWLIGAFLERVLANDIASGRLKLRNWTTFFGYKKVADLKVVFEHGSSIKWNANSYGGVPWYAVSNLGPRYEGLLGGADLVFIGHGHRAAILPSGRNWMVVNGALPATSSYVISGMKVVQRPLQWLVSCHRELGATGFIPLYADVPEALLPGMIWENPEHYAGLASGWAPELPVDWS